ncbi:uncharacterized protein G2W53_011157 [Senna tora]|uniref:Uncharacterized protein n=1 Tax=Senna tora TaxID=362788 RepID=A0A834X197_9FABA|nr:uncharacterized protein G2W53_011157 [Senna tora]
MEYEHKKVPTSIVMAKVDRDIDEKQE